MTAYLREHPNRTLPQYRSPRRAALTGAIVVHTAENTPDFVAFDGGAEAVADWISRRDTYGSYHELVDSDSSILLVDYDDEAFHDGTGGNRFSLGLSVATRADVWPLAPASWRAGAVENAAQAAARMARHVHAKRGIVVPAKRITAAQYRAGHAGFVSHGELDPGRRSDPGAEFPWSTFLARYAELTRELGNHPPLPQRPKRAPIPEEADMAKPYTLRATGPASGKVKPGQVWLIDPNAATAHRPNVKSDVWRERLDALIWTGVAENREDKPVPCSYIDSFRKV